MTTKKHNTPRIPIQTLITWVDGALCDYDTGRENNPARRVADRIKMRLVQYLYGRNFDPGFMFENVDAAIDALRRHPRRSETR